MTSTEASHPEGDLDDIETHGIVRDPTPAETSITFPVDDEGLGEAELRITVTSGDLSGEALLRIFQALTKSKAPITVAPVISGAMPHFVPVPEAARLLGVPVAHIKTMMRTGWLPPVHYLTGTMEDHRNRVTAPETADATGDYRGWKKVIAWVDIQAVAEYAMAKGRFPTNMRYEFPNRPRKLRHGDTKGVNVAYMARKVLREATDESGEQQWLTMGEIHERTRAVVKLTHPKVMVTYRAVQHAISTKGVHGLHCVEGRNCQGYRPDDPHWSIRREFRWVQPNDDTFERPGRIEITLDEGAARLLADDIDEDTAE